MAGAPLFSGGELRGVEVVNFLYSILKRHIAAAEQSRSSFPAGGIFRQQEFESLSEAIDQASPLTADSSETDLRHALAALQTAIFASDGAEEVLNQETISLCYWHYGAANADPVCEYLYFSPDGRIKNYSSQHEYRWEWDQKDLVLFSHKDVQVARFDNILGAKVYPGATFSGYFILGDGPHLNLEMTRHPVEAAPKPFSGLRDNMAAFVVHHGYEVGDYSYGGINVIDGQYGKMKVGKFCSIGPNLTVIVGNHDHRLVTTYPFMQIDTHFNVKSQQWDIARLNVSDHFTSGVTEIGNDVWTGSNVTILSGRKIGDGAVLAAGAMVTKDVPPYAIVGGNPARVLKYRFDEDSITRLLALKWWDWPREKIDRYLPLFMSQDIKDFIAAAEEEAATQKPNDGR